LITWFQQRARVLALRQPEPELPRQKLAQRQRLAVLLRLPAELLPLEPELVQRGRQPVRLQGEQLLLLFFHRKQKR
jgi:hypothetical protein